VFVQGESDGCEGDGGGCGKHAAEAFGLDHVAEHGEEADHDAADDESQQEVHGSGLLPGLCDQGERGFFALDAEELVLLALQAVVVHEELLNLFECLFGHVFQFLEFCVQVSGVGHGYEAIVADRGRLRGDLFAFDDADEAGHESAAGEGGFVHED